MFLVKRPSKTFPVMKVDTINQNVIKAKYAVRGEILDEKNRMMKAMTKGEKFPFSEFCELNIGNPQIFRSKPISFFRKVIATALNPHLLETDDFSDDVKRRAGFYLDNMKSIGAYTRSSGDQMIRQNIADFIGKRDGVKTDFKNILLYNGASEAIANFMELINQSGQRTGFMIPIPQYPLYSAQVQLHSADFVGYYLDEDNGWELDADALVQGYEEAIKNGTKVKAIIVINPGNPTGAIFSRKSIETLFNFAFVKGLVVLADEVYQENIYTDKKEFVSFRKVLSQMPDDISNSVELISFHSCSKGFLGECGVRGGYAEMHNIDPKVVEVVKKQKTIYLCPNTVGQLMMDLKIKPPSVPGDSKATVEEYNLEVSALMGDLKQKALILETELSSMKGVYCNPIEGAMYGFPRLDLPKKFCEEAAQLNRAADAHYCMLALKETGAVMVPGSGFKQREGTHHLRTTILPSPTSFFERKLSELKKFHNGLMDKYSN